MHIATDNPVYFRQFGMDDVEFRWAGKKRPADPFTLLVRSVTRPNFEAEFSVEDVHAPVTAYLMQARIAFAQQMEKEAHEHRDRRRAAEDERTRKQRDILEGQKRQSFGQEKRDAGKDDEVKKPTDRKPRKKSTKRTAKRTKKG